MNSRRAHRFLPALVLLITTLMLSTGCSKSPAKPKPPQPIEHADADDIVQVIATTVSADNGGWYFTIKAIAESLSIPPPAAMIGRTAMPSRWVVPLASRAGVLNNFSMTRAGITYNFEVGYLRANGTVSTMRDTSSVELAAYLACDQGTFTDANGITGLYGLHPYQVSGAHDSTFSVTGLLADTLEFSGIVDDSCYCTVKSTIAPNAGRNWYHVNTVDWTLRIPRSQLVSAPYPYGIDSEINWIIEAKGLNAAGDRAAFAFDVLVEARMSFDGTADAVVTLADIIPPLNWSYHYKVNINTGKIQRLD